jgi:hypothetical protein
MRGPLFCTLNRTSKQNGEEGANGVAGPAPQ